MRIFPYFLSGNQCGFYIAVNKPETDHAKYNRTGKNPGTIDVIPDKSTIQATEGTSCPITDTAIQSLAFSLVSTTEELMN